ncbi:hypothetical protein [Labedaea rhizosphaerae]|uniref:hypothetical protein n=1 Tax=Labedaea rhizosphaerae TaxID=598644 RepID=UPI00105B7011|nr:hypothetical protein [Labedaea rhizosphaerae]
MELPSGDTRPGLPVLTGALQLGVLLFADGGESHQSPAQLACLCRGQQGSFGGWCDEHQLA